MNAQLLRGVRVLPRLPQGVHAAAPCTRTFACRCGKLTCTRQRRSRPGGRHDPSGPYTDPQVEHRHRARARAAARAWISARDGRGGLPGTQECSCSTTGSTAGARGGAGVSAAARVARLRRRCRDHPARLRARRPHHPGDGVRRHPREPRRARGAAAGDYATATACGAPRSLTSSPGVRARRGRPRPRHHPGQHQPPGIRADDHRPQLPGEDQRQHRQLGRHLLDRRGGRQDGRGRSAGAPTRSWTCRPGATSTTSASGSCATRRCRSAPCRSTRRWRRSAARPRI